MRRFWWLSGLVFVCCLAVYVVGTGWLSAAAANSAVRHARRQVEAERVVVDMVAAQQAVRQHRDRVMTLSPVFPNPDWTNANAAYQQFEQFRQQFQFIASAYGQEAPSTFQFATATQQLKTYRVPSFSIMRPGLQKTLGAITVILGVLTALLFGVRFLANE